MLLLGTVSACAQEVPKAVDLGLSVQWADKDIAPETDIPQGWRMPTLAEIKELREGCTQSFTEKDGEEWIVFTAKNGNNVSFLYPIGSRSARAFGIAGSDGNHIESAPERSGTEWVLHLGGTGREPFRTKKISRSFSKRIKP